MSESDGCTCCQVRTGRPGADDDECPKCGHLMGRHYRAAPPQFAPGAGYLSAIAAAIEADRA